MVVAQCGPRGAAAEDGAVDPSSPKLYDSIKKNKKNLED